VFAAFVVAGCSASASSGPIQSHPSPTADTTATPGVTASSAAATFAWRRSGSVATSAELVGVAASPAGYVVLERLRIVWFSPDGLTWTKVTLPFETTTSSGVVVNAHANEIVGGPNGFIAIGGYTHPPCTTVQGDGGPPPCAVGPISWSSNDGLTWRSSLSTPIPSDGSALPAYSEFALAWPAGDGWDAAIEARDSVLYHGDTLVHSKDGFRWVQLESAPLPEGAASGDDIYAHGGVAAPNGRRVLWQVRDKAAPTHSWLSTTSDGSSWTTVPTFDGRGAFVRLALGPADGRDGPWLLAGDQVAGNSQAGATWFTDDLATWFTSPLTVRDGSTTRATGLERWKGTYLAVGVSEPINAGSIPVTWLSPDGLTWSEVAGSTPSPVDGPVYVVAGPAGLLGVGTTADTGAALWFGAGG